MSDKNQETDPLRVLRERAKELDCLYKVEELLASETRPLLDIFRDLIATIPCGWQYPEFCQAKLVCEDRIFEPPGYVQTPWKDTAPIRVESKTVGLVEVSYVKQMPSSPEGLFLEKESKLIRTIADRIGQTVYHRRLGSLLVERQAAHHGLAAPPQPQWRVIVDLLRRSDQKLYLYTSRKMLHHLFWSGVKESRKVLNMFGVDLAGDQTDGVTEANSPQQKQSRENMFAASDQVFAIAARHLNEEEILSCLHMWIQENKLSFLIKTVDTGNVPLGAVIDAILRYRALPASEALLAPSTKEWLKVSLIRRFFSDNTGFINIAKR
ncbi:MAG TPA: hypothetical protein PK640_09595, partial [Verrucomicrobiota bacterium]|nr:hypothetical protein [Verrucomicrobiota bacterium]